MTDPQASGPTTGAPRGVSAEALALLGSLLRHIQALVALAGLEGREAAGTYLRGAVAIGAALIGVIFAYVFLLVFIALALDRFARLDWVWIAFGYAVFHAGGALAAGEYARRRFGTPVFRGTAEELRSDIAALRPKSTP